MLMRPSGVALIAAPVTTLLLAACAAAPAAGVLPVAPGAPDRRPGAASSGPSSSQQAPAPTPSRARGDWSVADRGPVAPPSPPSGELERPRAAVDTVVAYLAAVVAMVRTGDDTAFLAVTTDECACRSVRRTAMRLATAGGVPEFDVQVRSLREVDSAGAVASVVLGEYVIPAHVEPAAGGEPQHPVAARRATSEFYVLFRGHRARVDRALPMRSWPA